MAQIRLENVSYGYVDNLVEDLTLTIAENDRIGVVGNNGIGKSTLLNCIAGTLEPNSGKVSRPRGIKFGFIEQDVPANLKDLNMFEVICAAIPEEERDFSSWKADVALDTFKAPANVKNKAIRELSGGWQRLALIARTWMTEPDVLLLDEPTNHLDLSKMMVLEAWLNEQVYGIPVVSISHDRHFLDSCTNKTLFIRGLKGQEYPASYSRAKTLLAADDKAAASHRDTELKELERLEASAHELRQIGINDRSDTARLKAKQIQRRADVMRAALTEVHVEERRDIKLSNSGTYTKRLIEIKDLTVSAPDGTKLFHIPKLDIMQNDRIVILGINGSGKSQFVKAINAAFADLELSKERGIHITPTLKLGYIDQDMTQLPHGMALNDYFEREFRLDTQRATKTLVNAGFPFDMQNTKIVSLSQGQRSRTALLALRLASPNFFIMDEPTNHLDIAGQEQLEREILEHEAACILVSHDRTFLENIGNKFFLIKNGRLIEVNSPDIFYAELLQGNSAETEQVKKTISRGQGKIEALR